MLRGALAFNGYDALLTEADGSIVVAALPGKIPDRPNRDPDFVLVEGIDVFVESGSIDYVSVECTARVAVDRPRVDVFYDGAGYPRADLLVYAIIPLMARAGYYGLHAGAVSDGETGYLFVGDSGGGKSTSTVLAASAGWDFISDDFVYLRELDGELRAFGLRETVCLRDDAASHFPDYIRLAAERGDGYKYRVPARQAFPGRVRPSCRPEVIIIPEVADVEETMLEPVARSKVLVETLRQSGPFMVDARTVPDQTTMLRDLIQHCECRRMRAGRDILNRPETLTEILSSCLASS